MDIDTFAMDNGGTAKEGVGRTYAGVDGLCPLASYIGAYGWPLALSLRTATQHSAKDTEDNLKRVIPMAQRLSATGPKAPLLAPGFGVRLGRPDGLRRVDEPAWAAAAKRAGELLDQVEPAQHGPRRGGRAA